MPVWSQGKTLLSDVLSATRIAIGAGHASSGVSQRSRTAEVGWLAEGESQPAHGGREFRWPPAASNPVSDLAAQRTMTNSQMPRARGSSASVDRSAFSPPSET